MSNRDDLLLRATQGLVRAQIELGYSHLAGRGFDGKPFPQDFDEAKRWLRAAHRQGALTATAILGTLYEEGRGVERDIGKAIKLYETAARRGAYLPSLYLARIYAQGKGVPVSPETAVRWYESVLANADRIDEREPPMREARDYVSRHR